jgi:hypothetical protein
VYTNKEWSIFASFVHAQVVSAPSLAEIQRREKHEEEEREALELIRIFTEQEAARNATAAASKGPKSGRPKRDVKPPRDGVKCT